MRQVRQTDRLKALLRENGEAGEAISTTLAQVLDTFCNLSSRQQLAMKKLLLFRSEVGPTGSPASPSAPSKDSLPHHCLTNCLTTASPINSPVTATNNSNAGITSVSASNSTNSNNASGNVTQDNSTKNFAVPSVPKFKVGDKCKAKHPDIYGLPGTNELKITKIEGNMATVTFDGCRSVSGVDVPLSDLEPVEE